MSKGSFETVINDHLNSPVNRPLNDDVNDQVNGVVRACFEDVVKGVVSVVFGNGITDVVKAGITDVIEDGIIGGIIDGITDGIIGSVDGVTEVVVEDHINIRVNVCFNDYPEFLHNDVSDGVTNNVINGVINAGTDDGFIGPHDAVINSGIEVDVNIDNVVCVNDVTKVYANGYNDGITDDYPECFINSDIKTVTNELQTDRSDSLGSKKKVKSYKQRLKHDSKSFPKFPLRISQILSLYLQRNAVL